MMETLVGKNNLEDICLSTDNIRIADAVIRGGEGRLKRGAMLGRVTATGKWRLWDSRNTDGSENFAGVLGCDVDATSNDVKAFVYVEGSFKREKLTCGYGQVPTGVFLYGNIVIK